MLSKIKIAIIVLLSAIVLYSCSGEHKFPTPTMKTVVNRHGIVENFSYNTKVPKIMSYWRGIGDKYLIGTEDVKKIKEAMTKFPQFEYLFYVDLKESNINTPELLQEFLNNLDVDFSVQIITSKDTPLGVPPQVAIVNYILTADDVFYQPFCWSSNSLEIIDYVYKKMKRYGDI